jgi:hypothetical protein
MKKKTLLELYALVVCFATLTCFTVSLGIFSYDLVRLANPAFTLSGHQFNRHQSNEAFKGTCSSSEVSDSDEEQTKLRLESYERALAAEKRKGTQSLVYVLIVMLVNVLIFVPHWLIGVRIRREAE